jgi:hypothetical protein
MTDFIQWEYVICRFHDLRGYTPRQWIFEVIDSSYRFSLEELGEGGWELAAVDQDERYIFKRLLTKKA